MKLVGGSNAFVRRPFLYTGVLYGLLGALIAVAIVLAATALLPRGCDLAAATAAVSRPRPGRDDTRASSAAARHRLVRAWIAAARHLRSIEPRA